MKVVITAEAYQAIRAGADPTKEFKSTARLREDGNYELDIEGLTLERINKARFKNEQLSDTILRVCLTADKPLN